MIAPAPGQIWIANGTHSAFADVLETYSDGRGSGVAVPRTQAAIEERLMSEANARARRSGRLLMKADVEQARRRAAALAGMVGLHGLRKVGYRPIVANGFDKVTVIDAITFASEFTLVVDLARWLGEFQAFNPRWEWPTSAPAPMVHQVWERQGRHARILKAGPGRVEWSLVLSGVQQPRPTIEAPETFVRERRYMLSVLDVLASARRQVDEYKGARG